jgi:acetyltransferase-like isoleucine patch superfamily enzyme
MDHGQEYEDPSLPIKEQGSNRGGTIRIGQGSWIGHGAAIVCSKGELILGRNCIVAANAVITRSFPEYSVISGNPARIVKQYDSASKSWVLGSVRRTGVETESQRGSL